MYCLPFRYGKYLFNRRDFHSSYIWFGQVHIVTENPLRVSKCIEVIRHLPFLFFLATYEISLNIPMTSRKLGVVASTCSPWRVEI